MSEHRVPGVHLLNGLIDFTNFMKGCMMDLPIIEIESRMTIRQLRILRAIGKAKTPTTVRGVAKYLNIGKPPVTRGMDTLESFGLARRQQCKRDGRSVDLFITDVGREFLRRYVF